MLYLANAEPCQYLRWKALILLAIERYLLWNIILNAPLESKVEEIALST